MVARTRLVPSPPFRADHVGSLLRSTELVTKRADFDAGQCSRAELTRVEDAAIPAIVQLQKDVGLKIITDGEMRRSVNFPCYFRTRSLPRRLCGTH